MRPLLRSFAFCRLFLLSGLLLLAGLMPAQAQVVINEIMADNNKSVPNGADYPDWVEIYNAGTSTVNIGLFGLTDDATKPFKFSFPPNTLIGSHGYLIVWCDSNVTSPGLHTGFSLKQSGETVSMYNGSAGLLDTVTFSLQITDETISRIPNGTGAWTLGKPTPALANVAMPLGSPLALRINEWMALTYTTNNSGGFKTNDDWFEVYNTDQTNAVNMGGTVFEDDVFMSPVPAAYIATPALYFIPPGGFLQFFASGTTSYKDVNFKLSSSGADNIRLFLSDRTTLVHGVGWVAGTQTNNISQGLLPDGNTNNIVYFRTNQPSPAASNFLPLTNVVVSEALTHTDPPLEDAIEIQNISNVPVDVSKWWISNRKDNYNKFQIAAGTVIPAGGFKVFYEGVGTTYGFNKSGTGNDPDFTLNSAHGDSVYLFAADSTGKLTGFRKGVDFEAAAHGYAFGRYITSDTNAEFTAMSTNTFGHDNPTTVQDFRLGTGLPNAYPLVGPVVINEIMYHPPNVQVTNDDSLNEFIELHCISTTTNVPLYDPFFPTNQWRLDDAVTFTFPPGVTMTPNSYLVVVNFDPAVDTAQLAAFKSRFNIPANFTSIYGPYGGKLKNSSASIKLYRPDGPQEPPHPDVGFVPYILMDKVSYNDSAPWPTNADGFGSSLQRRHRKEYGNDPANWFAQAPTPGRTNAFAGPLHVDKILRSQGNLSIITFGALEGQTYSLDYKDVLPGSSWINVSTLLSPTNGPLNIFDNTAIGAQRFYRLSTPTYP